MFRGKLGAVCAAAGAAVVRDEAVCDLAVIELDAPGAAERLRGLVGRGVPVLAFGSHVDAEQLRAARPVLAVYSSAIRANSPELQAAAESNVPAVRRATMLAALSQRQRGICVAGMHGKTTTSALLSFALYHVHTAARNDSPRLRH